MERLQRLRNLPEEQVCVASDAHQAVAADQHPAAEGLHGPAQLLLALLSLLNGETPPGGVEFEK